MKRKNTKSHVMVRSTQASRLELVKIARQSKTERFLRLSASI